MSGTLRGGQVAAAAAVHVQMPRSYERRGLLPAPARGNGGHRRSRPRSPLPFATPAGGR
ncbi:hypothetical protein DMB38_21440 [Streptomyces sp. WAC 06738]|uniref:MerR family DNA-binding transcriptional regulator n=1 Tax=Streptomyces sp. WAC 06738 TaxID=2203210 RepID=UPI000F70E032|nr:MerR family DNA-binding transcriptional regulator [Streptomyces sp. WAC 06738]AZM48006.1 hypothetical protein DMB38_21440 [Streptomyces sp. WAC 06738]